jgi:hypothetical protein
MLALVLTSLGIERDPPPREKTIGTPLFLPIVLPARAPFHQKPHKPGLRAKSTG